MNWHRFKILYEMESKRVSSFVMPLIFSILVSVFLALWIFRTSVLFYSDPYAYLSDNISSFLMYFFVFFGMSVSLLYLVELKSDESRGIVDTFLTYPIGRGDFGLAKLLVYGFNVSIITLVIALLFLIFSGEFLILGLTLSVGFILGILLVLLCSFSVSFAASVFIRHSPLSEVIAIFYFVGGFLMIFIMSKLSPRIAALVFPFSVVTDILAGHYEDTLTMVIYLIVSVFAYLEIIHLTHMWLNVYRRRSLE